MKFLIVVFLPASPFINFGDFFANLPVYYTLPVYYFDWNLPAYPFIILTEICQHPRLLFWLKFASIPVYSALSFYLKLESISLINVNKPVVVWEIVHIY